MPALAAISALDWAIVAAYGMLVVGVAAWSQRRKQTSDDYLMGGRRLPWWLLGMSIIATAFSSISLLGWTGMGYTSGPQWLQLQLGELIAIVVVCSVFLPFFARLRLTTAYEYLERRFGPWARWFASAMFHVQVLARAGLFLFLTARALAVFSDDLDVETSILVVGLVAMVYSSLGGLGAVVWTDGIQLLLVLGGVTGCVVLIVSGLPGGFADVWSVATDARRPPAVSLDPSLGHFPTLLSAAIAYGVLALSVGGTNQQAVQRYLACRDLRAARRAALLSWAIGAVIVVLTLGMGIALNARWSGRVVPGDDVFTTFIRGGLPAGLSGVMIAAIFAASMSSIDSAIHAMSTATLVDFVDRLRRVPLVERSRLRLARVLTLAYGVLAVLAAFYAREQGRAVIPLLLEWLSFLAGPVLGLFLLGILTRRTSERCALAGVLAGYAAVVLSTSTGLFGDGRSLFAQGEIHGIWAATVGCVVTFVVGVLLALGARRDLRTG